MSPDNDNAPRLMSFNEVCAETTLSRFAINALRHAGMFPGAVQLGERRIGFVRAEVNAWIDQRIAARAA
jgi:prophage regulatory protein